MPEKFELKFQVPTERAASLRCELIRHGATTVERHDHYFDTASMDLHEAGLSLRLRDAAGAWVQTLKGRVASIAGRAEH